MLRPYRDVFARPGAVAFCVAAVLARLPMSMVGISIVLVVSTAYGSYGLAGQVSAVLAVVAAISAPQIARLVDRHGQSRVMRPAVAAGAVGLVVLTVATAAHAHPAWLFLGAVLAGLGGNIGALVRARWSHVLAAEPHLVHTAYSLESALDELVFVVGPIAATALATSAFPEAGLVVPLVAAVVGGVWFLAQRRTEPPVAPRTTTRHERHLGVLRMPGIVLVLVVFLGMGTMFGATDVSTVAFASEHGHRGAAGAVLAVCSLGSLLAGLFYGSRRWHRPLAQLYAVCMLGLAVAECLFLVAGSLPALAAVMFVVGLGIAPSIISGNALVQALVPPARLTEGLSWVGTAINLGVSLGAAVAGSRIDAAGSRGGYLVVAGAAVTIAVVTALAYRGTHRAVGRAVAADEPAEPVAADVA